MAPSFASLTRPTGQQFPGNIIPAGRINRNGQALLNLFLNPNFPNRALTGGNYNYQFQEITELPKHQNLLKLDFNPTSRDKISFRGRTWWSDRRGYEGLAAFNSNWNQLYHHYLFTEDSIQGSYTRIFSPTVVNELTYNRRILGEDGSFKPLGSFTPNVDPVTRSKKASPSASSTLAAIRSTWFRFFRWWCSFGGQRRHRRPNPHRLWRYPLGPHGQLQLDEGQPQHEVRHFH